MHNIPIRRLTARLIIPAMFICGMKLHGGEIAAKVYYIPNEKTDQINADPVLPYQRPDDQVAVPFGVITVDTSKRFQTLSGVGAAFSEIGSLALLTLAPEQQKTLIASLFMDDQGAGFTLCRLPVAANDFATSAYSYAEVPDDFEMESFSLARDRKSIIPVAKAALAENPKLQFHASPWSPPGWMKTTGTMDKGGKANHLRDEAAIYQAYALYFEKYLAGYREEGISIDRLCPQNEVDMSPGYPGCVMPPEQMVKLVAQYLVPHFQANKVPVEIWAGTFREKPEAPWAEDCLKDDRFLAGIAGLGVQYFNADSIAGLASRYPQLRFMHTEANCDNGMNTPEQARKRFWEISSTLNSGCENYTYWNMILDENQVSGWKWKQNSLVTIDRSKREVRYNPDYQPVALVSRFFRPGDARVQASFAAAPGSGFQSPCTALIRPDGTIVIMAQNTENKVSAMTLSLDENKLEVALPPHADCLIVCRKNQ